VSNLGPKSFTGPGPFAAGETTFKLPSDGASVEVWYPATRASVKGVPEATYNVVDWLPESLKPLFPPTFTEAVYATGAYRDVPVAPGRFPLVEFTHGYSGYRDQSTFLTSRLATWGFVVEAPDLLDNDLTAILSGKGGGAITDDVTEVEDSITFIGEQNASSSSILAGHVDMHRVAAIGHSLGGAVSEAVAEADAKVTTFIGMAGATVGSFGAQSSGPASKVPTSPGMLMGGISDQIVSPAGIVRAFDAMKRPKRLVTLRGFGHLLFADICQIAPGKGGLLALAAQVHLTVPPQLSKLATDGCLAPDTPVTDGWPVVRQVVVAQLRHVFGFDSSVAALSGLGSAFPRAVSQNLYDPG
jgi:dienelactone hydrolase